MTSINPCYLQRVSYSLVSLARTSKKSWSDSCSSSFHNTIPNGILTSRYRYANTFRLMSTEDGKNKEIEKDGEQQQQTGRKRHVFRGRKLENLPSFRDFQLQMQIRQLFRRYVRLVWQSSTKTRHDDDVPGKTASVKTDNTNSTSSNFGIRRDIMATIKSEFRKTPNTDSWEIKRALSEGNRRYKELDSMLSTTSMTKALQNKDINISNDKVGDVPETKPSTNLWPWNNNNNTADNVPRRPLLFPSKSK